MKSALLTDQDDSEHENRASKWIEWSDIKTIEDYEQYLVCNILKEINSKDINTPLYIHTNSQGPGKMVQCQDYYVKAQTKIINKVSFVFNQINHVGDKQVTFNLPQNNKVSILKQDPSKRSKRIRDQKIKGLKEARQARKRSQRQASQNQFIEEQVHQSSFEKDNIKKITRNQKESSEQSNKHHKNLRQQNNTLIVNKRLKSIQSSQKITKKSKKQCDYNESNQQMQINKNKRNYNTHHATQPLPNNIRRVSQPLPNKHNRKNSKFAQKVTNAKQKILKNVFSQKDCIESKVLEPCNPKMSINNKNTNVCQNDTYKIKRATKNSRQTIKLPTLTDLKISNKQIQSVKSTTNKPKTKKGRKKSKINKKNDIEAQQSSSISSMQSVQRMPTRMSIYNKDCEVMQLQFDTVPILFSQIEQSVKNSTFNESLTTIMDQNYNKSFNNDNSISSIVVNKQSHDYQTRRFETQSESSQNQSNIQKSFDHSSFQFKQSGFMEQFSQQSDSNLQQQNSRNQLQKIQQITSQINTSKSSKTQQTYSNLSQSSSILIRSSIDKQTKKYVKSKRDKNSIEPKFKKQLLSDSTDQLKQESPTISESNSSSNMSQTSMRSNANKSLIKIQKNQNSIKKSNIKKKTEIESVFGALPKILGEYLNGPPLKEFEEITNRVQQNKDEYEHMVNQILDEFATWIKKD